MVLMRVPRNFYQEDRELQQKVTSDKLISKIKLDKDEYAPDAQKPEGGNSALKAEVTDPTL